MKVNDVPVPHVRAVLQRLMEVFAPGGANDNRQARGTIQEMLNNLPDSMVRQMLDHAIPQPTMAELLGVRTDLRQLPDEVVTRFISWKACSACGQPIHGEAWAKQNGSSARHKPECPSQLTDWRCGRSCLCVSECIEKSAASRPEGWPPPHSSQSCAPGCPEHSPNL